MKKAIFSTLAAFASLVSFSQNTFPTTGSAGVGTTTPATLLEVKSPIDAFSTGTQYVGAMDIGWTNDYGSGGPAQWLLLTPYIPNGSTGKPAAGLNGTLTFYRGNTSSGNVNADYHVNIQAAYGNTYANLVPLSASSPVIALHVVTLSAGGAFIAINPADINAPHSAGNFSYFGYYWNNFSSPQNIKPSLVLQSAASENLSLLQSFQSVSSNAMYVNTQNYIGIGTTTPSQGLEVNGNILSDGNVYIGGGNGIAVPSKTTGYALAVNGSAIFTQAVVKLYASWPDYVFEPAYKLRTLSSLNDYIQANKHLPDMPTADDIKKQGVNLGDAQAALLKKVEELTLYIIDQDKKGKDQQALLEKMQDEIKYLEAAIKK